jgi:two-component system osmolarity sensor histidine kinase EnvZ
MFLFQMVAPEDVSAGPNFNDTIAAPRRRAGLSLFWRTFFLQALLLVGCVWAWTETLHELEFEPRAIQTARQVASVVNMSRAAVMHTDAIARVSLFKTMRDQEHVTIQPREPEDRYEPQDTDDISQHITEEVMSRLGPDSLVAKSVNGVEGFWVGFSIDKDRYWLRTDRSRFDEPAGQTWLVWLLTAAALSLAGAAWIAGLINRPLKNLAFAAKRVRAGDFESSQLDENVSTHEIRAVNVGFNRMTQKLAKIEQERAVMLAGISHDLRTPLARLRLEVELSVEDLQAREHMANDITQIDAIIGKFLDYARPGSMQLTPVLLNAAVDDALRSLRKRTDVQLRVALQEQLMVQADPVELQRVISNLLENALRYGKTADGDVLQLDISARQMGKKVILRIRDHGPGVPPEQLAQLTMPFFRGETGRTASNSTGLGLAIVDQTLARMGGVFELSNANSGGLCANLLFQHANDAYAV